MRQLNDIWSQSLTRGAAELRGFNYTNEHSIRRSQRQPGAAQICHTGCMEHTRTHTHASLNTYVLTVAHTLTYHLHSPDTLTLMWEVDCICLILSSFLCLLLSRWLHLCFFSPLNQLFLSPACSFSPYNCLENVRSVMEIASDKCK